MITAWGLPENWSLGGEKVVYSLFCVFIIIDNIHSSISISFVVLLNCLHLNPRVSPFVYFSSPSCWGEGEERAGSRLVHSCQLQG